MDIWLPRLTKGTDCSSLYVELVTAQPPPRPAAVARSRQPDMRPTISLAVSGLSSRLLWSWYSRPMSLARPTFDSLVLPVLKGTCANCHNDRLASGGLNVTGMMSAASLAEHRPAWDKVLRRLRAGDMPPAAVARPAQLQAMIAYIERAFERADATAPADPGRVTAHRLNRNEYTNTISDLLGVRFRAEKYFPADDSGDGFDNIGDVLTVSPLLMERYLAAAERIAAWTMSTAIPAKPIESDYRARDRRIRRSIAAPSRLSTASSSAASTRSASGCPASGHR